MKRLIILVAVLLMSIMCVQAAFADVIVEKNFQINLKCHYDGDIAYANMNKSKSSFVFKTEDLIAKLGIVTGTVFSRKAKLIVQEYFEGNATSTVPTQPTGIRFIVRDGTNEVDVSEYIKYIELSTEIGQADFTEGAGGTFKTSNVKYLAFSQNQATVSLFSLETNEGIFLQTPHAFVALYNVKAQVIGIINWPDDSGYLIKHNVGGTIKITDAKVVSVPTVF